MTGLQDAGLILTLTGGLSAALVLGYVTHRLGLSPILGYLLAGIAIGPGSPLFVADPEITEQLAEIGVILLMFGVGLHFDLKDLLAVWRIAIPGAIGQSMVATFLTAGVTHFFGWDWSEGIVLGLAISVASTVVLVRVLTDNRDLHTVRGRIALGWLIVEDLLTIVILVLLPSLFQRSEAGPFQMVLAVGLTALKIAVLVALTHFIGGRLTPWLLERVAATQSRELFILAILVFALGIAVGSAVLFSVSMALGAFLAGMMVGRSEFSLRAATEALPMRDAFAVLFFVSIGMLFEPNHLWVAPVPVAATLGVILFGKPLAALTIVWLLRVPPAIGLGVAVALAQIGEFSFLLALLGSQLGVLPSDTMETLVAAAILSIMLNPVLYRSVGPALAWAAARRRIWRLLNSRLPVQPSTAQALGEGMQAEDTVHRAIIVGYGPVGRTAARLLQENGIEPTIIELNLETVRGLRAEGTRVVYGDATHRETLRSAGVETTANLILSPAMLRGSEEIIRLARELNPSIKIFARSVFVRDLAAQRRAGAETVFSDEGEVALAFAVAILQSLGASPEQIDRERERVHAELFGEDPPRANSRPPNQMRE
jgi:CPA2 family monovalent cation:H+ antiporter-2